MSFTYPERIRRLIDLPERDRWHLALCICPPSKAPTSTTRRLPPPHQPPARRTHQPSSSRKASPPVQPRPALGAALVEGRGECLFAGLVTTARSCPFHDFVTPGITCGCNGHPALTAERLGRSHEIMRE